MNRNKNLHKAKKVKDDEFYTRLIDIEKDVKHYKEHFKDKIVYCNCDNPKFSNFFIYFKSNFNNLQLKKLITTHYLFNDEKSYKLEIVNENGNLVEKKTFLSGNGDFRSEECIAFLQESDIVCTNPPFSLFREYVAQLIKYEKKFLIIGSINAIKYNIVFPLIKENKLLLGNNYVKDFRKPNNEIKKVPTCWFTNLTHGKKNEKMILWKEYIPEENAKYDNYDAIEVSKTSDIPKNYDGLMGVPITFLIKYNPEQFEIVGRDTDLTLVQNGKATHFIKNGKVLYTRIVIKHKS